MFASPLTLKDRTAANVTFNRMSSDVNNSSFLKSTSTLSAPDLLKFSHQIAKPGSVGSDRHLVQIAKTVLDANGEPKTATQNYTLTVPRGVVITRDHLDDMIAELKEFLVTANVTELLNGGT